VQMLLLLKPIEKYNQDSVSILQGALPYSTRPMEQSRVRFFSYAFFCQQSRTGHDRMRKITLWTPLLLVQ